MLAIDEVTNVTFKMITITLAMPPSMLLQCELGRHAQVNHISSLDKHICYSVIADGEEAFRCTVHV